MYQARLRQALHKASTNLLASTNGGSNTAPSADESDDPGNSDNNDLETQDATGVEDGEACKNIAVR